MPNSSLKVLRNRALNTKPPFGWEEGWIRTCTVSILFLGVQDRDRLISSDMRGSVRSGTVFRGKIVSKWYADDGWTTVVCSSY